METFRTCETVKNTKTKQSKAFVLKIKKNPSDEGFLKFIEEKIYSATKSKSTSALCSLPKSIVAL